MDDKEILKEIGFSEGEIKVYFSLFGLGETTVGPISKESGVSHAKVYPILEKLIEKGLVSYITKEGRKRFSATHPNNLLEFIDKRKRLLEAERIKIKQLIPNLLFKQKGQEQKQYSRVFEGINGLRALFYELFEINKGKEIKVFGLNELLNKIEFQNFFLFYHQIRIKNRITLKVIFNKQAEKILKKEYFLNKMYKKGDEIRFIDSSFPVGTFIIEDHVVGIVAEDKITAFDIKSKQNSDKYSVFFESLWKIAKR